MIKYYKITGMDEGEDITPFYVAGTAGDDTLDVALNCYGDSTRYYEPITKEAFNAGVKADAYVVLNNYVQLAKEEDIALVGTTVDNLITMCFAGLPLTVDDVIRINNIIS